MTENATPAETPAPAAPEPTTLPIDHPDHPVAVAEGFVADITLDAHEDVKEAGTIISKLVAEVKALYAKLEAKL